MNTTPDLIDVFLQELTGGPPAVILSVCVVQSHCECLPGFHQLDHSLRCYLKDACTPDACHEKANCTTVQPGVAQSVTRSPHSHAHLIHTLSSFTRSPHSHAHLIHTLTSLTHYTLTSFTRSPHSLTTRSAHSHAHLIHTLISFTRSPHSLTTRSAHSHAHLTHSLISVTCPSQSHHLIPLTYV